MVRSVIGGVAGGLGIPTGGQPTAPGDALAFQADPIRQIGLSLQQSAPFGATTADLIARGQQRAAQGQQVQQQQQARSQLLGIQQQRAAQEQRKQQILQNLPQLQELAISGSPQQRLQARGLIAQAAGPSAVLPRVTAGEQFAISTDPISGEVTRTLFAGGVEIDPRERSRLEQSEKQLTELGNTITTEARSAVNETDSIIGLQSSLKDLVIGGGATGPAAGAIAFTGGLVSELGFNIDTSNIKSLEDIQAISNRLIVPTVKLLGTNPTDRDTKIIESTVANVGKSMAANFSVLDIMKQASQKRIAVRREFNRLLGERDAGGKVLSSTEIESRIEKFKLNNPLRPARALPPSFAGVKRFKPGARFVTDEGIAVWDGENLRAEN